MVVVSPCCEVPRCYRINGHNPDPKLVRERVINAKVARLMTRAARRANAWGERRLCAYALTLLARFRDYVKSHGPRRLGY